MEDVMKKMSITAVGRIEIVNDETYVVLEKPYIAALRGLEGFGYMNVLWWFDGCDTSESRQTLVTPVPYRNVTGDMGVFATRSPQRPNPIALTAIRILHIDHGSGRILVSYIDANNMSPVIDLKPYTPSLDRVEKPLVPQWCASWPKSLEESAVFDWENELD